jgi:hypothetical protein
VSAPRRVSAALLAGILLLVTVAPSATASPFGAWCAQLFGRAPSSYSWTRRIDGECPVLDQRRLANCWVQAGVLFFTKIARATGAIGETETLSADYYFARMMEDQIRGTAKWRLPSDPPGLIEAGNLSMLNELIERHGFVAQKDYRFPKVLGETDTYEEGLGMKAKLQKEIAEGGDPGTLVAKYFGDLGAVAPRGRLDWKRLASTGWADLHGEGTNAVADNLRPGKLENADVVIDRIRNTLDAGLPVYSEWNLSRTFKTVIRKYGNYFFRKPDARQDGLMHSMLIVGYELENGRVARFLVQNSWGESFGQGGLFVADRYFVEKYMTFIYGWR